MTTALLSTTYFGPVQWYQKLYRYQQVLIEHHETFVKQSYRNRCLIATAQGTQALTVPVVHENHDSIDKIRISDHGNWRHLHWQAITSAYGDSPFLEYYEDEHFVKVHDFGDHGKKIYANALAGTNELHIIVCGHEDQTSVTALFDNLGKGASGAAVQNMNIMLGLDETTGLE